METENAELKNRVEDLEYDLDKTRTREEKLDRHLSDALEKLKAYEGVYATDNKGHAGVGCTGGGHLSGITQRKVEDLQRELEEEKELSTNRMVELEKLHQDHKEALKEIEKLKMDVSLKDEVTDDCSIEQYRILIFVTDPATS